MAIFNSFLYAYQRVLGVTLRFPWVSPWSPRTPSREVLRRGHSGTSCESKDAMGPQKAIYGKNNRKIWYTGIIPLVYLLVNYITLENPISLMGFINYKYDYFHGPWLSSAWRLPGDDPVPQTCALGSSSLFSQKPKSPVDGMFIYGITGLYVDDIYNKQICFCNPSRIFQKNELESIVSFW